MAQRITKAMNKPELYEEGRALEKELAEFQEANEQLVSDMEKMEKRFADLEFELSDVTAAAVGHEEEVDELQGVVDGLQREVDDLQDQLVNTESGGERLTVGSPNVRLAMKSLRKLAERGGIENLNQAERFIRSERRRLVG